MTRMRQWKYFNKLKKRPAKKIYYVYLKVIYRLVFRDHIISKKTILIDFYKHKCVPNSLIEMFVLAK